MRNNSLSSNLSVSFFPVEFSELIEVCKWRKQRNDCRIHQSVCCCALSHTHTHTHTHTQTHTHTRVHTHKQHTKVNQYMHTYYLCMYWFASWLSAHTSAYTCKHIPGFICMKVCMYACMYDVYIHSRMDASKSCLRFRVLVPWGF